MNIVDKIIKLITSLAFNFTSEAIILLFIVNFVLFIIINFLLSSIRDNTTCSRAYEDDNTKPNVGSLNKKKSLLVILYTIYSNFTAIFPLLGILGTVAALYQEMSEENMMNNFSVALGTTILGVFFAIASKVGDSIIAGKINNNLEEIESLIFQYDTDKRDENATPKN